MVRMSTRMTSVIRPLICWPTRDRQSASLRMMEWMLLKMMASSWMMQRKMELLVMFSVQRVGARN